ncbi:hypothetical protein DP091_30785 [Paenibacillus sp. MDMC362]|nr:hypothetical protein DP091_30785 [Paenibacillus sp. MDMC362]
MPYASNANFILEQASTEQAELFWRSGSGPLYPRISTLFHSFRRNPGVTGIGRTIRMRSDESSSFPMWVNGLFIS